MASFPTEKQLMTELERYRFNTIKIYQLILNRRRTSANREKEPLSNFVKKGDPYFYEEVEEKRKK